jgi:hypothetical protein
MLAVKGDLFLFLLRLFQLNPPCQLRSHVNMKHIHNGRLVNMERFCGSSNYTDVMGGINSRLAAAVRN